MINQEQIKNLINRKEKLYKYIDIEKKEIEYNNLEKETQANTFWDNPKNAQITLKKIGEIKKWIESYQEMTNNIEELSLLIELEARRDQLRFKKTSGEETADELVVRQEKINETKYVF